MMNRTTITVLWDYQNPKHKLITKYAYDDSNTLTRIYDTSSNDLASKNLKIPNQFTIIPGNISIKYYLVLSPLYGSKTNPNVLFDQFGTQVAVNTASSTRENTSSCSMLELFSTSASFVESQQTIPSPANNDSLEVEQKTTSEMLFINILPNNDDDLSTFFVSSASLFAKNSLETHPDEERLNKPRV